MPFGAGNLTARRSRNGGSAVLVIVLGLFIALFFLVAPLATMRWAEKFNTQRNESAYLDDVAAKLAAWYARNAATIDSAPTYNVVAATLWANLGIDPLPTLRVTVSDRLTGPTVRYRRFAIWLRRSATDSSAIDSATGVFTPGANVLYREISGEPIQAALLDDTLTRMKVFAGQLEKRFRAKFESDPFRSLSVNHFRPASGSCTAGLDDLPCIDAHTDVQTAANFTTLLALDSSRLVSAWGQRFTVSNLADSQTAAPPFSMAIRSSLPWGGSVLVNAVQPLN